MWRFWSQRTDFKSRADGQQSFPGFIFFNFELILMFPSGIAEQGHIWSKNKHRLPILKFWVFSFCGYIPRKYINIYKYKHKYIFLDFYFPPTLLFVFVPSELGDVDSEVNSLQPDHVPEHRLWRRIRSRNVIFFFSPPRFVSFSFLTAVVLRALEPVTSVQHPYDPNGKCRVNTCYSDLPRCVNEQARVHRTRQRILVSSHLRIVSVAVSAFCAALDAPCVGQKGINEARGFLSSEDGRRWKK